MDLMDDPSKTNEQQPKMRRLIKVAAFMGAAALALFLTIRHSDKTTITADAPLQAAARVQSSEYDLAKLPILTRVIIRMKDSYFDKQRFKPRKMLVGALNFIQRDVPEIIIDRHPEEDPTQVTVRVNGEKKTFEIAQVTALWDISNTLKEVFRFIQPNLQEVAPDDEARRLTEIEMAATNGILYTLDPHSVLMDVESFREMRLTTQGKFGGLGIVIELKNRRITVKKPMPETPAIKAGMRAGDQIVQINDESTVNMTLGEAVQRLRGILASLSMCM